MTTAILITLGTLIGLVGGYCLAWPRAWEAGYDTGRRHQQMDEGPT